jgi:hypothetical protein
MHVLKHIAVKSSNIFSIGYDRRLCILQVTFHAQGKPTGTYEYTHVTCDEVAELLFGESVGSYFSKVIKPEKPCRKLAEIITPEIKEAVAAV